MLNFLLIQLWETFQEAKESCNWEKSWELKWLHRLIIKFGAMSSELVPKISKCLINLLNKFTVRSKRLKRIQIKPKTISTMNLPSSKIQLYRKWDLKVTKLLILRKTSKTLIVDSGMHYSLLDNHVWQNPKLDSKCKWCRIQWDVKLELPKTYSRSFNTSLTLLSQLNKKRNLEDLLNWHHHLIKFQHIQRVQSQPLQRNQKLPHLLSHHIRT